MSSDEIAQAVKNALKIAELDVAINGFYMNQPYTIQTETSYLKARIRWVDKKPILYLEQPMRLLSRVPIETEEKLCCRCSSDAVGFFEGEPYCAIHYQQIPSIKEKL